MTPFPDQLRTARLALGLTQAQLAGALGVTGQTVSNWECGQTTPWPKQQVDILGKLLHLSMQPSTDRVAEALPPSRPRIIDRI